MNTGRLLKYVIQWLVLVALQVLLFKDLVFFNTAFCLAYIAAFLLLPFELGTGWVMLLGFGSGLVIDIFYDTLGVHAAAAVLTAYARGLLLKALTPAGGYEGYMEPTLPSMGFQWYALFVFPLAAIYCFSVFVLEYAAVSSLPLAGLKAVASCVFTGFMVLLVQNVLVPK
jgi:hypothetical protein